MKRLLLAACVFLFGCAPNIYRVRPDTHMCQSLIATECEDEPVDPNRIRLCGNAFANYADFEEEAKKYCDRPKIRNCAVQCCDVDCEELAPAATPAPAAAPAPAEPAALPTPPPPPPAAPAAQPPAPKGAAK